MSLLTHAGATQVTREELRALPDPVALGRFHKPVRHDEFVEALVEELARAGYRATREQYAIQTGGMKLFGYLDLIPDTSRVLVTIPDHGMAVGFRHANDQSLPYRMVAGERVFICDNLALMGDCVVLRRKHTTGFNLKDEITGAVERLLAQYADLDAALNRLRETSITDREAKARIYDAFVSESPVLPMRYLPTVNTWYFHAPSDAKDCQPRTLYGLQNAFTRTIKDITSETTKFASTVALGRYFRMGELSRT